MSSWRSGTISLAMVKRTASSASEAEEMTFLVICAVVWTEPLWRGIGTSSEIMIWAPARLWDCDTLRQAALLQGSC